MTLSLSAFNTPVGTTGKRLVSFRADQLHSILIKADLDMYIGVAGVSAGQGFPLLAGESIGFSHQDFDSGKLLPDDVIEIDCIAPVATAANVFLFTK